MLEMSSYPLDLANKMVRLGEDWVDKNAAADLLEESRKSIRAKIALESLKEGGTLGKAELIAESSKEYQSHVEAMIIARKLSNIAKINLDAHRVLIDMTRTLESTKRAEMNLR